MNRTHTALACWKVAIQRKECLHTWSAYWIMLQDFPSLPSPTGMSFVQVQHGAKTSSALFFLLKHSQGCFQMIFGDISLNEFIHMTPFNTNVGTHQFIIISIRKTQGWIFSCDHKSLHQRVCETNGGKIISDYYVKFVWHKEEVKVKK